MIYNEQFEGIRLDIQTVDLTISDEIQENIREMIKRLQRHISEINGWISILKRKAANPLT